MKKNANPVSPARPKALELIFMYACPHCAGEIPVLSPLHTVVRCQYCRRNFPIIPVEEKTVLFIKLMLANGTAAIDPDFM